MAADVDYHVRRYDRLWANAGNFRLLWQELAEFLMPRKSNIVLQRPQGAKQTERLFDSTPIHASELLSATMQGSITSNAIPWFHLKMRNKALNDLKSVQDWLEQVEERMYLALRQSNFNAESHEVYLDVAVFGIGNLYCEERPKVVTQSSDTFGGLRFKAEAIGEYVIDEDPDGRVDTVYTKTKMTAKAIVQKWAKGAKDEAAIAPLVGELIATAARVEPEKTFDILHCVGPRMSYDPSKSALNAKEKAFYSIFIALPHRKLLSEGGYDDFPYMVPRWAKTSGEMYGRGPGMTALPDVRTLNRSVELTLEAGGSAIYPPVEVPDDGVIGDVDMRAGAINVVDQAAQGRDGKVIRPIETGSKFDVSTILNNDLRTRIQHVFFWEQLQLQDNHQMTATEVEKRWELIRRVLGPTLGRLESEFLNPLIDRVFGIMYRAGALPEVPEELQAEGNIDVEYEGPLARSQKLQRIEGFNQWLMSVQQLVAIDPSVGPKAMALLELEPLLRDLASIDGCSTAWFKSQEAYQQAIAAMNQAQAQQAQLAQAQQIADIAQRGTDAIQSLSKAGANGSQTAAAA